MGAHKKYEVSLTGIQKKHPESYIRTGNGKSARKIARAGILLHCAEGKTYEQTAESVKVCQTTVCNTVKRFAENGLDFALDGKPFPGQPPKLDGKAGATLIAIACPAPPDGYSSWTMQMIADKLISPDAVDSVSGETVRRYLKKVRLSRGKKSSGVSAD
ncbi:MAG: helix-turn-helix domain-containing protein [Desulfococcaceae bacterium]